jgi:hypothetical protein
MKNIKFVAYEALDIVFERAKQSFDLTKDANNCTPSQVIEKFDDFNLVIFTKYCKQIKKRCIKNKYFREDIRNLIKLIKGLSAPEPPTPGPEVIVTIPQNEKIEYAGPLQIENKPGTS